MSNTNPTIQHATKFKKHKRSDSDGLSDTERAFVAEYCRDLNASNAYCRIKGIRYGAGERVKASTRQCASEMKNRPHVDKAINSRLTEKSEWMEQARREVVESLLTCLRVNAIDVFEEKEYMDEFGNVKKRLQVKSKKKFTSEQKHALASVSVNEFQGGCSSNVKIVSKTACIKLLVDILGMKIAVDPDEVDRNEMENAARTVRSSVNRIAKARRVKEISEADDGAGASGAEI